MVAMPMKLDEVLNLQGYTIDVVQSDAFNITLPEGIIHVPSMLMNTLVWHRDRDEEPIDSMYLKYLPVFHEAYRPVILSSILGHFRSRRICYNTPGEWANAVLRWSNENLGPGSILNRRWRSCAIDLPLDDRDLVDIIGTTRSETRENEGTREGWDHSLNVGSDFPQSLISGSNDYASNAGNNKFATNRSESGNESSSETSNETKTGTGRSRSIMALLEEQRNSYINVDKEFRVAFESLIFPLFDLGEGLTYPERITAPYGYGFQNRMEW